MGLGDDGSRAHLSQERQGAPCCRNTLREGRVGTGREERLEHWPGCGVSSLSEQWAAGGGFRPRGAMHECFWEDPFRACEECTGGSKSFPGETVAGGCMRMQGWGRFWGDLGNKITRR